MTEWHNNEWLDEVSPPWFGLDYHVCRKILEWKRKKPLKRPKLLRPKMPVSISFISLLSVF
jgi:hypothetical protein